MARLRRMVGASAGVILTPLDGVVGSRVYRYEGAADAMPPVHRAAERILDVIGSPAAHLQPIDVEEGVARVIVTIAPRTVTEEARTSAACLAAVDELAADGIGLERSLDSARRLAVSASREAKVTSRELVTLQRAMRAGYYESPRKCTIEDLARAMELSRGAVWKRLSRAESSILRAYISRAPASASGRSA